MKIKKHAVLAVGLLFALSVVGCASHKPKSTSRIISEGEENPQFHYAPERAGDSIRNR